MTGWILSALLASSTTSSSSNDLSTTAVVTGLFRHAVKGLSADSLESVRIAHSRDTFPDDRRFALLYEKNQDKFEESNPDWLHKENFLCAFTDPRLMARYEAEYRIVQPLEEEEGTTQRLLSLRDRKSREVVLGPQDLATLKGREALGDFFSKQSGLPVRCVSADQNNPQQKHQFGNTSSGWKQRKDTRTIHLVNANTVRQLSEKCNMPLNPTRFRPNMVVEGWEPWAEFDWIGKTLELHATSNTDQKPMKLSILSKTVRCDGVSIDPLDPDTIVDIPKVLVQHFPEHGPYLGIYAAIDDSGEISLGDTLRLASS